VAAELAAPTPAAVEHVVEDTVDDVVRFVTVLAEWLVPTVAIIIGLFVGPLIFNGASISAALWQLGLQSQNTTTNGANSYLIGTTAAAGIVGVAALSLWKYQEGRKGASAWISRAFAGFTIGWSLGILIGGLNAYFVTGNTAPATVPWLDQGILNLQSTLTKGAAPKGAAPT
jgi:hypothetical protein